MNDKATFDSWALVELMGHQRICGRVTEAEIGGCKFVRVDVPELAQMPAMTKYLGPASIYGITPLDEETALQMAAQIKAAPISIWDARRLVELHSKPSKPAELEAGKQDFCDDEDEDGDRDTPDEDFPL